MPYLTEQMILNRGNLVFNKKFQNDLEKTFGLDSAEIIHFCEDLNLSFFEVISEYFRIKIENSRDFRFLNILDQLKTLGIKQESAIKISKLINESNPNELTENILSDWMKSFALDYIDINVYGNVSKQFLEAATNNVSVIEIPSVFDALHNTSLFGLRSIPIRYGNISIDYEDKFLFHGTLLKNVASILEFGPLPQFSEFKFDFNSSFYLSFTFCEAKIWAEKKSKFEELKAPNEESKKNNPVVLIFKREYLDIVNLIDLRSNFDEWVKMMTLFRKGIASEYMIAGKYFQSDGAIGPRLSNPKQFVMNETPIPESVQIGIWNSRKTIFLLDFLESILLLEN